MDFSKTTRLWHVLLALALIIGIGFRFYNLDKKVVWMDEASSIIWLAGYSSPKVHQELLRQRFWTAGELAKFQRVNADGGVVKSLAALSDDDPKHPPLFYGLLRAWAGVFGDSVFALRLLPAVLSLLVFPALWFLCRELFREHPHANFISIVALILMALSPFHVVYAQELREYSLWTAILLASSALFLRALRLGSWQWWTLYAIALAVGLYTHTLSLLIWPVHGAYLLVLWWQKRKSAGEQPAFDTKELAVFFLACAAALLLFSPWALLIWQYQSQLSANTSWISAPSSAGYVMKTWVLMFGTLFFDPDNTQRWAQDSSAMLVLAARVARVAFFAFVLYALVYVWRAAPRRIALFVCLMALIPFAALALPDLLIDGYRSTVGRFMIPSYLAVQLAVAYLVADKLTMPRARPAWAGVLGLLVASGVLSCAMSSQAEVWWNKTASFDVPAVARLINAQARPLVLTEPGMNTIALSRLLARDTRLYLFDKDEQSSAEAARIAAARKSDSIYSYHPTPAFREALKKRGVGLRRASDRYDLWQLEYSGKPVVQATARSR